MRISDWSSDVCSSDLQETVEFTIPGKLERAMAARVLRLPAAAVSHANVMIALYDLTGVKQSERMRADIVAHVSPELRTPLTSLIGLTETLSGPAGADAEAQARLPRIREGQRNPP